MLDRSVSVRRTAGDCLSEFEVAMQARLALERIEGGEEAKGSVWKQMTESRKGE
ncbi:Uncharacterised protein [Streptococcus pneumoniae]|nr:Uncharacterised protein [Streptococcus pneumoniae]